MAHGARSPTKAHGPRPPVKRYYNAALLALLYTVLLVVPWALFCVLSRNPWQIIQHSLRSTTSVDDEDIDKLHTRSVAVYRTLYAFGTLAGVVGIPLVLALLARAAAVASQRRRPSQTLNLRQLFALADGRWISEVWSTGASYFLAFLATSLLALVLLTPVLRAALVGVEDVPYDIPDARLSTFLDFPRQHSASLGFDPSPVLLHLLPQKPILETVRHKLASARARDLQPYSWPPAQEHDDFPVSPIGLNSLDDLLRLDSWGSRFLVSAVPALADYGVRPPHALGVSSTGACEAIEPSAFPDKCPGERPFETKLTYPGGSGGMRVCAPGHSSRPLWKVGVEKQEIEEELFLDVTADTAGGNFTVRCTAKSTRGYFKLGQKPSSEVAADMFVDELPEEEVKKINQRMPADDNDRALASLTADSPHIVGSRSDNEVLNVTGPLMMASLALFGDGSVFAAASNQTQRTFGDALVRVCEDGLLPFMRLEASSKQFFEDWPCSWYSNNAQALDSQMIDALQSLTGLFRNTGGEDGGKDAARVLDTLLYFVNEAYLTAGSTRFARTLGSSHRELLRFDGVPLRLPTISTAAAAAISVLIGLQALLVLALLFFIYSVPVWTETLDGLAVARVALQLGNDAPLLSRLGLRVLDGKRRSPDLAPLERVPALVGVVDEPSEMTPLDERYEDWNEYLGAGAAYAAPKASRLMVGGQGVVPRFAYEL